MVKRREKPISNFVDQCLVWRADTLSQDSPKKKRKKDNNIASTDVLGRHPSAPSQTGELCLRRRQHHPCRSQRPHRRQRGHEHLRMTSRCCRSRRKQKKTPLPKGGATATALHTLRSVRVRSQQSVGPYERVIPVRPCAPVPMRSRPAESAQRGRAQQMG